MPLKHHLETFLVFVLGVVMVVTGILLSTLPTLPKGALPWGILFVLTVIYPLTLSRLFKKRRADYSFRILHWIPALMLLLWLAVQGATLQDAGFVKFYDGYTWSWTLPAVAVGFVLLVGFCLNVIRRRKQRIILLLVAFVPYAALAVTSETQQFHWEQELAAVVWAGDWWDLYKDKDPDQVAVLTTDEKNLAQSSDAAEERWRERLRRQEERKQRLEEIEARRQERKEEREVIEEPEPDPEPIIGQGQESSLPTQLPGSGLGSEAIAVLALAGYTTVLQRRVKKRR